MKNRSIADLLHEFKLVQQTIEGIINDSFNEHEPDVYETLEFRIDSDHYDNSIEIYITNYIPYPYEPCWKIRNMIYSMGFNMVYWNFADQSGKFTEEIVGGSPRRFKQGNIRYIKDIGDVDDRFNKIEWELNYRKK